MLRSGAAKTSILPLTVRDAYYFFRCSRRGVVSLEIVVRMVGASELSSVSLAQLHHQETCKGIDGFRPTTIEDLNPPAEWGGVVIPSAFLSLR